MWEETLAYFDYLFSFNEVQKPKMPKFNVDAYNDNEYIYAIHELQNDYEFIDDFQLTLNYLKGE